MTPIERAERAKQILEDKVLLAVFDDMRAGMVSQLEMSEMSDHETHHEVALTLMLLKQIRVMLARYASQIEVDKQKSRHEEWLDKVRETIVPPMLGRKRG